MKIKTINIEKLVKERIQKLYKDFDNEDLELNLNKIKKVINKKNVETLFKTNPGLLFEVLGSYDYSFLKLLLENGFNIEELNDKGCNLFEEALKLKSIEFAELLFSQNKLFCLQDSKEEKFELILTCIFNEYFIYLLDEDSKKQFNHTSTVKFSIEDSQSRLKWFSFFKNYYSSYKSNKGIIPNKLIENIIDGACAFELRAVLIFLKNENNYRANMMIFCNSFIDSKEFGSDLILKVYEKKSKNVKFVKKILKDTEHLKNCTTKPLSGIQKKILEKLIIWEREILNKKTKNANITTKNKKGFNERMKTI